MELNYWYLDGEIPNQIYFLKMLTVHRVIIRNALICKCIKSTTFPALPKSIVSIVPQSELSRSTIHDES